jgi:hypothetical protein
MAKIQNEEFEVVVYADKERTIELSVYDTENVDANQLIENANDDPECDGWAVIEVAELDITINQG